MYLQNYKLRNTWLDNFLEHLVSEDLLTGNMVNGLKHCFSLNDSTFAIFIDQCEGSSVRKSLS